VKKKSTGSTIKFYILVLKNRIGTLKKYIFYPALLCFFSILAIELFLNHIPAKSKFQYDLGQIYLKLCYSFTSAFLFYFLVVHLPKEKKKTKVYRFINNKTHQIGSEIGNFILTVSEVSKVQIDREKSTESVYEDAFKKINPKVGFDSPVEFDSHFDNWKEYLFFKSERIKSMISDLLSLNESIDAEFLEILTLIEDDLSMHITWQMRGLAYQPNLVHISDAVFEMVKNSNDLKLILRKKYGRYAAEYHAGARVRNIQRWSGKTSKPTV
jgi:hypothetical protein